MDQMKTQSPLELLYSVSRDLANELELRPLLKRILVLAVHNVGAERGSIVVLNEDNKPIEAAIIYGDKIYTHTLQQLRETIDKGMAGWVVRHHKAVVIDDTRQDQRWVRRPDDEVNKTGAKSAICIPLTAHKKLVGVLTVVHPVVEFFGQDHLNLLQSIGDIAGIATLNARLYAESQRRTLVMSALIDNAVALNSSLHLDEVLNQLLKQTLRVLHVETVAIAFVNQIDNELLFRACWGVNAEELQGKTLSIHGSIAEKVIQQRTIEIAQETEVQKFAPLPGFPKTRIAAAPITSEDKVIGVLFAINPKSEDFDPDTPIILNAIGSLAGTAIRNAQNYEMLQESNQRYSELFENSIDPILITDPEGRIIEANLKACHGLRYTKDQLLSTQIGKTHYINMQKLGEAFANLPSTGMISYESEMISQTGWETPVEACVRRVNYGGKDSIQWILRDISERIDLDSLRNDLVAMIYHDLRSPLANVTASLDILSSLSNGDRDDTTASLLNIAMRSSDRIQRLLNSLLDLYRLEAGQAIVNRKPTNPTELLAEVLELIQPGIDVKDQTLTKEIPSDLPDLLVDADMIRRVLINLIENASKFSPIQAHISINVSQSAEELIFRVTDDGPGIAQEDQERIFDKFSRLKMAGSAKGMGLGLAFCRLAVQGHGGKIWVDSAPGKGSSFFFSLPITHLSDQTVK